MSKQFAFGNLVVSGVADNAVKTETDEDVTLTWEINGVYFKLTIVPDWDLFVYREKLPGEDWILAFKDFRSGNYVLPNSVSVEIK